jgi:hypothetical protein
MLPQKLITLAAILAILACGACFQEHYTPPPPPAITGEGLKNLGIVVNDTTELHHLNTAALSSAIAEESTRFADKGLAAHLGQRPEDDGDIEVNIVSAAATKLSIPIPNGLHSWNVEVRVTVSLKRADGKLIWQGVELMGPRKLVSYADDSEEIWRDPLAQQELLLGLGRRIVYRVTYQSPDERRTGP